MGCGCGGARKQSTGTRPASRAGKTLYQVVLNGGTGRTAFQTHNEALAKQVAGNYPGSVVRPDSATETPVARGTET
ncbi:hypothetical protein PV518_33785 [Streptomyces sp. ND04-05B]|uniref:hypothetical protein n=1 Tax=Streptomyces sp. ND04-05B TaxID=3028693 RepID=UPI0029A5AD7E|nr:hypothetical protein [Streptomyces sp. ND04-05B]MDX3067090.1 hypothetical protein [Streptomyces sp. ND04-05B]